MIAGLGITVGPGLGHAYAGRRWSLAKGTGFRTLGVILVASGLISDEPSGMGCWGKSEEECKEDEGTDAFSVVIGSVIYLWSTIHDFRTLDDSVERYNQQHAGITVSVSPTYFASENALGVVVSVGF